MKEGNDGSGLKPSDNAARPGHGEFKCTICRGIFEKGWSDEEAGAELDANFPGFEPSDCDLVCDDCFKKMFPKASPASPAKPEQTPPGNPGVTGEERKIG